MGVGIIAVIKEEFVQMAVKHLKTSGVETYEIGVIRKGTKVLISITGFCGSRLLGR